MKTLELTEQNALTAYAKATDSEKKFLKNLYPNYEFNASIMDRVKSYEDACAIKGVKPLTIENFAFLPENQREYMFAVHKDDIQNEVLNEGWEAEPDNDDQPKYFPRFYWDEDASGGPGFSYYGSGYGDSTSGVGARRTYRTPELAVYSGKQFIENHRVLHNPRTK